MPTSAAGSKPAAPGRLAARTASRSRLHRAACALPIGGFTLIELLVVVGLIAIATAGVGLALRDSADTALERDAQRLAAALESARAQARASEARAVWVVREGGFVVQGLPTAAPLQRWLSEQTRAQSDAPVVLGPEPLIAPQSIALFPAGRPERRLWVTSDGLRPFEVRRLPPGATP